MRPAQKDFTQFLGLMAGVIVLTCVILASCSCSTTDKFSLSTNGIPNLRTFGTGKYRGGQPETNGWAYLYSQGVRRVVKLNTEAESSDNEARRLGMDVVYIPLDLWMQAVDISNSKVEAIVEALSADGKIFVHCEHGRERTGFAVALYRINKEGWPLAKAEGEMMAAGYRKTLTHGLSDYLEDHYR